MRAPNAFISNGTCYHGPGKEVDDWFPCGNAALGDKTCCQRGDMCLSSRACYNGRYGITYLAGCSDSEYRDESCPDKGALSNQPWAGLVYCNGTSEQWVACEQSARPTTLTSADVCWCPQTSRTVAFTDSSILNNIVQLPTALGGSVIWQPGFVPIPTQLNTTPTPTPASTTTDPTTAAGSSTAPPPTATATNTAEANGNASQTTGSKIGIGVGVGVGCAVLLVVLVFLFFARRRMQKGGPVGMDNTKAEHGSGPGNSPMTPETTTISELEPNAARPWSLRTELDGTPRSTMSVPDGSGAKVHDQGHSGFLGRSTSTCKSGGKGKTPPSPIAELPG